MNLNILEKIERTGKRAEKELLLSTVDDDTRALIHNALDPDVTYGVTVDDDLEWESNKGSATVEEWATSFRQFLSACAMRKITGNAAGDKANDFVQYAPDALHSKYAKRFINRQLRVGFDIRTYNKVFKEGQVKKFAVQLADTYAGKELRGLWYVQPKLDGNRVVMIDGKAFSRNGKEYAACAHIISEFKKYDRDFFKNWVVDGEMMGNLGFDKSSGALRRDLGNGKSKAEFTYWVFDLIDRSEWERKQTRPLVERKRDASALFAAQAFVNSKLVPTTQIVNPTHTQIMDSCDAFLLNGFEGAMFKDALSPYVFKRGKNLLKVKRFKDADLMIVGFYEGKGKHRGRLGGINVSGKIGDRQCDSEVGSGFSDALREEIWADKGHWIYAIVAVQYQDFTPDGSLRFPVFLTRRKDKE